MMRNKDARHIDFAELYGLFDKRLPSNVDMIMERHGRFLIGEWKREVVEDDVMLPRLFLAFRAPAFGTPTYYAGSLCSAILGQRRGSRL